MGVLQINQLRKSNQLPFTIVGWIEKLAPVVLHDELGTLYRGAILAQDDYGLYTAVVGTTDQLLKTRELNALDIPYKILKIENDIATPHYSAMLC
jgi:hypothetical protein